MTAYASEPEIITPLGDTYVDGFSVEDAYGDRDYLEVADYASGLSIISLMFDISEASQVLETISEVTLRLYCFYYVSPHIVSVHWCVNNTWNEENLTFISFSGFFRTSLEDLVKVDTIEVWYEWTVTNFVKQAARENYDKITLTLEVEDTLEGTARSLFASKDHIYEDEYPQLVFVYAEPEENSTDITVVVAYGLVVTATVVFLAYWFIRRHKRKTRRHKSRSKSHVKRR